MIKKILTIVISLVCVMTLFSQVSNDTIKVVNLNDVEVISLRPSSLTPISQKIITSIDIKKEYHGQEMTYILEKTPSVTTNSDGGHPNGYTYFRIRGIDQTRINVTLNGSPLNEPEDQGAYYSNYPGFATYIKSLQVQRGVGTSSNGTASFGGSINFETEDGLDKKIDGSVTIGSFNTRQLNVSYGSGLLKNNFAFFGGISTYYTDGYRQNSGGSGSSAFFSGGYYGKKDIVKLTAFTGISKNQMAWKPTPDSLIKIKKDTNILSKDEKDNFNQSMIQLQYSHSFNNSSIITSNIYYNNLNGVYGMILQDTILNEMWYNVKIDTTKNADLFNYNLHSNFFGGYVNYRLFFNNFDINIGTHMNTYSRRHIGKGNFGNDKSYNNTGYKNEISGYLKVKYTTDKIVLFGDVQVRKPIFNYSQSTQFGTDNPIDTLSLNWGTFINPMGGLTYKLSENEKIYTSIGLTHREPTRTDMFGDEFYFGTLRTTKVESVIDYELGYKLNTSRLNINTNLYFMYFNNQYIPSGKLDISSLMEMKAVDKSYRMGIDFDGKYKITDNFSASNFTTISRNKILSNGFDHVLYSPSVILNQDIEYEISNFYINLSAKYISETYINLNDKNTQCPNYTTLNAIVGYSNKLIDLSVTCINLTNTKYYTFGNVSIDGTKNYFVGAPISFYTTIRIKL